VNDRILPAYRFAIVGAGLAGLSLARAFARFGVAGRVAIIDAKTRFADDRTWSFWDIDASADARLAAGSWQRWQLQDESGTYAQRSSSIPYIAIKSRTFYDSALADIQAANYDVFLGERITEIDEAPQGCMIRTRSRTIHAEFVFDARGLTASMVDAADVVQRFAGYRIVAAGDTFDASVATLMDVQADTDDGFHFFYVLPFGPGEALIENTYFARRPIGRARLENELDRYIARRFGVTQRTVVYRETGALPMSARLTLPPPTHRVLPIGLRGGCARPGTGYTFHRVQNQVERIARLFAHPDATLDGSDFSQRAPWCDAVLLAAARHTPDLLHGAFRQLFATIEGDALARFMMDRTGPIETFPVLLASAIGAGKRGWGRASALPHVRSRLAPR